MYRDGVRRSAAAGDGDGGGGVALLWWAMTACPWCQSILINQL